VTESCHCEPPEQEDHTFGRTERGYGNLAFIIRSRKKGEIATVASSLAMTHKTDYRDTKCPGVRAQGTGSEEPDRSLKIIFMIPGNFLQERGVPTKNPIRPMPR